MNISTSFIIGVGRISNRKLFDKYCKRYNLHKDIQIMSTSEIIDSNFYGSMGSVGNRVFVETSNGQCSRLPLNIDKEELFVIVSHYGWEGRDVFCSNRNDGHLDYNIDRTFFDIDKRALLHFGKSNGICEYDYTYGAETGWRVI